MVFSSMKYFLGFQSGYRKRTELGFRHLVNNRVIQFSVLALALDQIFNDGKGRKKVIKTTKKILK